MPKQKNINKVMIIGSGPIVIGQACEFDYSGTQACKALRKLGYEIVLVNSNPATIMTDPGMADVTYIEPLDLETMTKIVEKERPDAILPNLGGQSGLNLSSELARAGVLKKYGVKIIGVEIDAIERGEDRGVFKETMNKLGIEIAAIALKNFPCCNNRVFVPSATVIGCCKDCWIIDRVYRCKPHGEFCEFNRFSRSAQIV